MTGSLVMWTMIAFGVLVLLRPSVVSNVRGRFHVMSDRAKSHLRRSVTNKHESNLQICEKSAEALTFQKTVYALASGIGGLGLGVALGNSTSGVLLVILPIAAMVAGFFYPDFLLQAEANRRRKSFRYGFSSFLDLVTVLLAGGSGIESALSMASEAGDGQTFEQIRKSLRRSQVARTSPWDELADLGQRFGIDEIVEVAGSVELAGRHGARIRDTLLARAATLRHRQLSEIEADAASATERMGMPMVLLFVGFISLVGYPAVAEMLQGW